MLAFCSYWAWGGGEEGGDRGGEGGGKGWAWVGEWHGAWDIVAMARRCMARGRWARGLGGSGAAVLFWACSVTAIGEGKRGGVG